MKILNILTYYYPHNTGLTRHVQSVSEELVRRGHEVTVLASRHLTDLKKEETLNGVRIVRVPYLFKMSRGVVMPFFPFYLYQGMKAHDKIIINTPILESGLIALTAKILKKSYIIVHHGDLLLPKGFFNHLIQSLMFAFYRYAAQGAAKITGYSKDYAGASYYLSPFIEKVACIYPPAEIPEPVDGKVVTMRDRLALQNKKVVGYAGRFVKEKRPDRLLKAIPRLAEKFPNIKILFAGEHLLGYENYFAECKPLIKTHKDNIQFLGLINDRQELANFYRLCDVLVLPSESECLGLVQVESMYCGTPVIVNNIPGAREAVKATGMGEIVDCENAVALSEAIERIINKKQSYVKPRKEIESIYSLKHTADDYESVLSRI